MSTRDSSRTSLREPTPTETPKRLPPNRIDPLPAIIGNSGTVRSVQGARQFLEESGWILAREPYDHTKLTRIIATVATGEVTSARAPTAKAKSQAKNALIAVALLLDADITDHISDTLANAVATKTLARLEATASSLATSATFASANDTNCADTTVTLQKITETLATICRAIPSQAATWASVARANIPASRVFNPDASDRHTRLQQRVIRDSRIVTFEHLTADPSAPQDTSTPGLLALRTKINETLATADTETDTPDKTLVRGIMASTKPDSDKTTLTIELDTPKSAQRILKYATDVAFSFPESCLGNTSAVSK
ncbi:hypothetical protein C0991_012561 [Blastosporella zonata]|nr:hypothetical protein C0991_012561 [Blastosporella zonata]